LANPLLISLERTGFDALRIGNIWSDSGVLRAGYTSLFTLGSASKWHLIGYRADEEAADAYEITSSGIPFRSMGAKLNIGSGWDAICPFVLGNKPYLMCYRRQTGVFGFFEVYDDLSVSKAYRWAHPRDPGLSVGFTTVRAVVCVGQLYFFGYNFDTGNVVLYSLAITSKSADDIPPLAGHHLWQRSWAQGWARFAFFVLGGGNFFLKTNTRRPNVNIDHIQDNPSDGTVEIATQMNLTDAQDLTICESFVMADGEPFFAAYKKDGTTAFYRFHSDCQGWTEVASGVTVADVTQIATIPSLGPTALLFY
jgi:hypothetical protein